MTGLYAIKRWKGDLLSLTTVGVPMLFATEADAASQLRRMQMSALVPGTWDVSRVVPVRIVEDGTT